MNKLNLSTWALKNQPLVLFMIVAIGIAGILSYGRLGQSEDPPFTFKGMTVRTLWPGASAAEVDQLVTERIERKMQEVPNLHFIRSYSRPGESTILFIVDDAAPTAMVPVTQYEVRKRVGDMRHTLPAGVLGPFFNDEFGDTFGNIFALSGQGYSYADKKIYIDRIRRELLRVPDVSKVEIFGEQEEKILIEISNVKIANLGIDGETIITAMRAQNAVVAGGTFETATDKIFVRASGHFDSVESIRDFTLRANGRLIKIGDIATVKRAYADPPLTKFRYLGQEALGLGISMRAGGDILTLGENLDAAIERIEKTLPIGIELHRVNDQPRAVRESIGEFVRALAEAVIIVMAVTFFSLGMRSGMVVALSIPLVLAATFFCMYVFNVGLHKISLGALILSLGLLVDDAIIAIEMMSIKMEQGWDRMRAASFAYTSTAFPMLSGTLVTAAGFLPIATAKSSTGEYTIAIFQVTTLALLLSWFAAVIFIPYLGYHLLPDYVDGKPVITPRVRRIAGLIGKLPWIGQRLAVRLMPADAVHETDTVTHDDHAHDVYNTPFYQWFRAAVTCCVLNKKTVLMATGGLFIGAVLAFGLVQQQFFPSSTRVELIVDVRLAEGSSIAATETQVKKLEAFLDKEKALFENYVSYIGTGAPRFYLPLDLQLPNQAFGQIVVTTNDAKSREILRSKLIHLFETDMPEIRGRLSRLENGPPVGFPIQYRVSGEDLEKLRTYASEVAEILRTNGNVANIQLDWNERSKVIKLDIDQNKARLLGLTSAEIAAFVNGSLSGTPVTHLRENDKQIEILLRGPAIERAKISLLESLSIPTHTGRAVPLTQVAKVQYEFEDPVIWRRDRLPTITIKGDIYKPSLQPATIVTQLKKPIAAVREKMQSGYLLEVGGAVEESARGVQSIKVGMPLFVFAVLMVLMIQLKSFQRVIIVVLTAPLGLIGVTLFLIVLNKPFGFVAMLGTIALFGMIMRNSVILIDQIEQDIAADQNRFEAVIGATVRRLRPIVLTAMAAVLAMIPLVRSAFFGPMAVAIMGGLLVATLLTLFFLPALYATWFGIHAPDSPAPTEKNVTA